MSSGRFFVLDDQTSHPPGMGLFRYTRLFFEKKSYPIYIQIHEDSIEFFYSAKSSFEHTRLFKVSFQGSSNPQGDLTQHFNQIHSFKKHKILSIEFAQNEEEKDVKLFEIVPKFSNYSKLNCWQESFISHGCPSWGGKQSINEISSPTLFLDFLFDLEHSQVFRESPYYEKIKLAIEQNHLFKAILAKSDYYYQKKLWENDSQEIVEDYFIHSTEHFLEIIMNELSPKILGESPWFEDNIEKEILNIVSWKNPDKNVHSDLKQKLRNELAEWYLERFDYLGSLRISIQNQGENLMLYSFGLIIPILICLYLANWISGMGAIFIGIFCLDFMALYFFTKDKDPNLLEVFVLFMPKLTLTLFAVWVGTYAFTLGKIPKVEGVQLGLYLIFSLVLVFIYLTKEIKKIAPDLNQIGFIGGRISFIIIWTLTMSGLIGGIVISFALQSNDLEIVKAIEVCTNFCNSGLDIAFYPWLNGTIFVFFFGLFVNLLFKGQKFTGF